MDYRVIYGVLLASKARNYSYVDIELCARKYNLYLSNNCNYVLWRQVSLWKQHEGRVMTNYVLIDFIGRYSLHHTDTFRNRTDTFRNHKYKTGNHIITNYSDVINNLCC